MSSDSDSVPKHYILFITKLSEFGFMINKTFRFILNKNNFIKKKYKLK